MSYAADPARRAAILKAEQERLDWLKANPGVPVWFWGSQQLFSGSRADVDAVAALAAQEPQELPHAYRVTVEFGAGVSYVARAAQVQAAVPAQAERGAAA